MPNHLSLMLIVHAHTALLAAGSSERSRLSCRDHRGQATTEYALVLLAAALVGLLVVAWATAGGGAQRISRLFNGVIDAVIDKV
jgi:Flp pilus assembly pilin Flp